MSVKGSCLYYNTEVRQIANLFVTMIAADKMSKGLSASIANVYREIRRRGLEIDLPTVGEVYKEVSASDSRFIDYYSTDEQVDRYTTKNSRDAYNLLAELETLTGQRQIGAEKPERALIANFLVRALYDNLVEDERTVSDARQMQDALWKGMQRFLPNLPKEKPDRKTMEQLIDDSLGLEKLGVTDLEGHLNSIEDLFYKMREELREVAAELTEAEADPATIDRWMEYTRNLQNATYKLLFRKQDALRVRDEALIRAGFGKKIGGREALDWDKLAAYSNNISSIRENVEKVFLEAGYSPEVVERLKDTLENEFHDLRASLFEKQQARTEMFAASGARRAFANAAYNELLGGRTEAEWIKSQNIEDIEELHKKVNAALAEMTYDDRVKRQASKIISDWFARNYAKVATAEAKKAINDILDGRTVLEWIIDNGIENEDELYEALDNELFNRNIAPQNDLAIREEFNRILDIKARAERELAGREKRIGATLGRAKKTDLHRLAELYHLGAFSKNHEKLLFKILGVDEMQAEDLADVDQISRAISDLIKKMRTDESLGGYGLGLDIFAATELQTMQTLLKRIIQRNQQNKTLLGKIVRFVSNLFSTMLTGVLVGPITLAQNATMNALSTLTASRVGRSKGADWKLKTSQEKDVFWAALKDVTKTGQAYGEEIGYFASQELYLNTLKFKWGTAKEKAESILYIATIPARVGLLGLDSANKVLLTNKVFNNMVFQALKSGGKFESDQEIYEYMNEALYGQSFQDAKAKARIMAERSNSALPLKYQTKITDAYVTRLANDIVKANLTSSGLLTAEAVEAILKSSYHVAGLGIGHEPNNVLSVGIKALRDKYRMAERKALDSKTWNMAAFLHIQQSLLNTFVIQFLGGATNWVWLRLKGAGLGIAQAALPWAHAKVDWTSMDAIKRNAKDRESARNDIARAMLGLSYAALSWFAYYMMSGDDDDDKKRKLAEIKRIEDKKNKTKHDYEKLQKLKDNYSFWTQIKKNNPILDRMFRAIGPDLMLIAEYYRDNSTTKSFLEGLWAYVDRSYMPNDQYSKVGKFKQAYQQVKSGETEFAMGTLASMVGDNLGVPLYKSYKTYAVMIGNLFRDEAKPQPVYLPPTSVKRALFGGGFLEDIGLYRGSVGVTAIPGVGGITAERFKKKGYITLKDLERRANWWNMRDDKGAFFSEPEKIKAKEFWKKYLNSK